MRRVKCPARCRCQARCPVRCPAKCRCRCRAKCQCRFRCPQLRRHPTSAPTNPGSLPCRIRWLIRQRRRRCTEFPPRRPRPSVRRVLFAARASGPSRLRAHCRRSRPGAPAQCPSPARRRLELLPAADPEQALLPPRHPAVRMWLPVRVPAGHHKLPPALLPPVLRAPPFRPWAQVAPLLPAARAMRSQPWVRAVREQFPRPPGKASAARWKPFSS